MKRAVVSLMKILFFGSIFLQGSAECTSPLNLGGVVIYWGSNITCFYHNCHVKQQPLHEKFLPKHCPKVSYLLNTTPHIHSVGILMAFCCILTRGLETSCNHIKLDRGWFTQTHQNYNLHALRIANRKINIPKAAATFFKHLFSLSQESHLKQGLRIASGHRCTWRFCSQRSFQPPSSASEFSSFSHSGS